MREERVGFYSAGERVAGILRLPDDAGVAPCPAIVQGPGWLQLKEARRNLPYHRAFVEAGFAVLVIDFRGFGESEGDPADLSPARWLEDLTSAVTYLTTRGEVDPQAIATFGSGGTGGGNAILLAAGDPRVRCAVSQVPICDGADWLRRMRREHEWYELLARLEADRRKRVLAGAGELVQPRGDIMVTTPERKARESSGSTESGHVQPVRLAAVEALIAYRPIDVVDRAGPLLVVAVADDPVTPSDHATALYERAREPKQLIMQHQTTHYAAYEQYADVVIPQMVAWFRRHLREAPVEVRETTHDGESRRTLGSSPIRPIPEEASDGSG
jgi:dipeptidyl aminopeptidase/acylaminoacyl peptidase